MGELSDRRRHTAVKLEELKHDLNLTNDTFKNRACVYLTGSYGRGEASQFSDLDLFILGRPAVKGPRLLNSLDEICLKAELITTARKFKFEEFSKDGKFLVQYTEYQLIKSIGQPEDDSSNAFTARLLLLLESQSLIGDDVYNEAISEVVAAYWRDYPDHKDNFKPTFLTNDILRMWRTFCVNYEAKTDREPIEKNAEGKLKNYKLKHSRLLTCFSAILYLLAVYREHNTVSPDDAKHMVSLSPTKRLDWLIAQKYLNSSRSVVGDLLEKYEDFLISTNKNEKELVSKFMHKDEKIKLIQAQNDFGKKVFEAVNKIGEGSDFLQRLLV